MLRSIMPRRPSQRPEAVEARIRRRARRDQLVAHRSRHNGLWYFSNYRNWLQSPEQDLSDEEALEFLEPDPKVLAGK
jgi:hypothetical protein